MGALGVVELQGPADRIQHSGRHPGDGAALELRVVLDADIGEIVVYVPRDVSTTVTGSLNVAGDVEIGGREQSGFSPDITTTLGTSPKPVATLELDIHGHLGHIEVRTR